MVVGVTPSLLCSLLSLLVILLGLCVRSDAKCVTCGDVGGHQQSCRTAVSLGRLGQLQASLLLNCQAALWPFSGDGCCRALDEFGWKDAVDCLCGGQTGLSGLVISAKSIVETCGCEKDATGAAAGVVTGTVTGAATGTAIGAATGAATGGATGTAIGGATGAATGATTGAATGATTGAATGATTGTATGATTETA
jgi:hypothetical protein